MDWRRGVVSLLRLVLLPLTLSVHSAHGPLSSGSSEGGQRPWSYGRVCRRSSVCPRHLACPRPLRGGDPRISEIDKDKLSRVNHEIRYPHLSLACACAWGHSKLHDSILAKCLGKMLVALDGRGC